MARSVIGLDIGSSAVRAAELRGTSPATLVRFAQVALPPGAVVNGEIVDPALTASVIKDLWARGQFRRKRVSVAVAASSVVVRQVDIPRVEEGDLREGLAYQVGDYIPYAAEEAMLDFLPLDEISGPEGQEMVRLLIVAAQRDTVDRAVTTVREAGLDPMDIDLAPFATVRALVDEIPPVLAERQAVAIIDIGAGMTNVVVCERGIPRFARLLAAGGSDITTALAGGLSIPVEEAEHQKAILGVAPEGVAPEAGGQAIIQERVRLFIEDVRASLAFYASQPDAADVRSVLLTGGGSLLPGLRDRVASALSLQVDMADALARVKIGDLGLSEEQLEHVRAVASVAIGLGLES
ncbi:MAG TPA: type IV pilus assembly protein PilM [Actinomycetota bacterium]|nr:type IV pilus assembly protein PilM [Actinomycetota bacterium]